MTTLVSNPNISSPTTATSTFTSTFTPAAPKKTKAKENNSDQREWLRMRNTPNGDDRSKSPTVTEEWANLLLETPEQKVQHRERNYYGTKEELLNELSDVKRKLGFTPLYPKSPWTSNDFAAKHPNSMQDQRQNTLLNMNRKYSTIRKLTN
tara:strand:- start:237 stop:689 length:453 start_codon:yes stop_codon:yes gene_type:complete